MDLVTLFLRRLVRGREAATGAPILILLLTCLASASGCARHCPVDCYAGTLCYGERSDFKCVCDTESCHRGCCEDDGTCRPMEEGACGPDWGTSCSKWFLCSPTLACVADGPELYCAERALTGHCMSGCLSGNWCLRGQTNENCGPSDGGVCVTCKPGTVCTGGLCQPGDGGS